jgi:phage minor structural protein
MQLLLDDGGVLDQIHGRIIRDNFNVYILPAASRSLGFEIRYGKNLLAANLKTDISDVVTRVLGVGKDENDNAVWGTFQDSSHRTEYGTVARVIKYTDKTTRAAVNAEAAKEFTVNHIDEPKVTLDAEFVALELAPRYAELANQYAMHIYDSVRVYDPDAGIDMTVAMSKYEFDVLAQKYTRVTLGMVDKI